MEHYEEYVHAVVEAGADLIVSGAGLPTELPKYVGDSDILLAPIVSTAKSANVILKYWDKKYQRIPDLVVIEGPLAGGHLGFREDQLDEYEGQAIYDQEIQKIKEIIQNYSDKYEKKIPIAIGGGIHDSESAAHAFSLGADAIQVATRFVTTEECDADIRYKRSISECRKRRYCDRKKSCENAGTCDSESLYEKSKRTGQDRSRTLLPLSETL